MDKKEITGWYNNYEGEDMGIPVNIGEMYKTFNFNDDESYIGTVEDLLKKFHNKKIKITIEVLES